MIIDASPSMEPKMHPLMSQTQYPHISHPWEPSALKSQQPINSHIMSNAQTINCVSRQAHSTSTNHQISTYTSAFPSHFPFYQDFSDQSLRAPIWDAYPHSHFETEMATSDTLESPHCYHTQLCPPDHLFEGNHCLQFIGEHRSWMPAGTKLAPVRFETEIDLNDVAPIASLPYLFDPGCLASESMEFITAHIANSYSNSMKEQSDSSDASMNSELSTEGTEETESSSSDAQSSSRKRKRSHSEAVQLPQKHAKLQENQEPESTIATNEQQVCVLGNNFRLEHLDIKNRFVEWGTVGQVIPYSALRKGSTSHKKPMVYDVGQSVCENVGLSTFEVLFYSTDGFFKHKEGNNKIFAKFYACRHRLEIHFDSETELSTRIEIPYCGISKMTVHDICLDGSIQTCINLFAKHPIGRSLGQKKSWNSTQDDPTGNCDQVGTFIHTFVIDRSSSLLTKSDSPLTVLEHLLTSNAYLCRIALIDSSYLPLAPGVSLVRRTTLEALRCSVWSFLNFVLAMRKRYGDDALQCCLKLCVRHKFTSKAFENRQHSSFHSLVANYDDFAVLASHHQQEIPKHVTIDNYITMVGIGENGVCAYKSSGHLDIQALNSKRLAPLEAEASSSSYVATTRRKHGKNRQKTSRVGIFFSYDHLIAVFGESVSFVWAPI